MMTSPLPSVDVPRACYPGVRASVVISFPSGIRYLYVHHAKRIRDLGLQRVHVVAHSAGEAFRRSDMRPATIVAVTTNYLHHAGWTAR